MADEENTEVMDSQVLMLREALRSLADDLGLITEEALQNVAGFESIAASLEAQLGRGPWHVATLEELFFDEKEGKEEKEEKEEDEEPKLGDVSPVRLGFASPPRRHPPRRHTVSFTAEAHHLAEDDDDEWFRISLAVEEALREEDTGHLAQLLKRMWQMMQSWDQHRQRLQQDLDRAAEQVKLQSDRADQAEQGRLAAEAAEAATQTQLEEQQKRLQQGREALKSRDHELEEARQRLDLQEADLREQQLRLRQAEEKLRRRAEVQQEQQQSVATPRERQDALAKKLLAAEADLEVLRHELLSAEEAAAAEHERAVGLEAALEQSQQELTEWKQQAMHKRSRAAKSRSCTQLASPLSEELQGLGGDAAAGPKVPAAPEPMATIFDRKARLQAQLRGSKLGASQVAKSKAAPSRPSKSSMPGDMASLSRLLGGGLLGATTNQG